MHTCGSRPCCADYEEIRPHLFSNYSIQSPPPLLNSTYDMPDGLVSALTKIDL